MASDLDRLRLLYDLNRRLSTFTDLDELVRYMRGHAGVWFATHADVARYCKTAAGLG